MFVEKVKSDGLAHLSYIIGDGRSAAVVDPRRDCQVYVDLASRQGAHITHIFETHRNEDLVSGAPVLADWTGAGVYHGPNAAGNVAYAETVADGAEFRLNGLRLQVLETPGHTDDSLSIAVFDDEFDEEAIGVFSGDALFVGDVGRTDFYPDRAEEVAGLLFDSLKRICALGDQAILWPAHGAGSVCGDSMADREFSTIGHERINNPMLRIRRRDEFIERKLAEHHDQPPYFRHVERLNLEGCEAVSQPIAPRPLSPSELPDEGRHILLDVRGVTDFLSAHIPGSLAIPDDMLSAFAGWLLEPDQPLILVATSAQQAAAASRELARIGYDQVEGHLAMSLTEWAASGRPFASIPVVDVRKVSKRMNSAEDWQLLDVRSEPEAANGILEGARNIYVGELPCRLHELDRNRAVSVMCASGARATIAASVLRREGFENADVFLGSYGAWKAAGNPTVAS